MTNHQLKTVNPFFTKVALETKTCKVRKFDRDYKIGDRLTLQEYDPNTREYSGREIYITITDLMTHADFEGVQDGWCVISFNPLELTRNFTPKENILSTQQQAF